MTVDIKSMNNNYTEFAYDLDVVNETSKSIYAESKMYGWVYRIEKKTGRVFRDGKMIAETSSWKVIE